MIVKRASWKYFFGQVQWRSRASWKQRAGWNLDFHMARSFFWISIWRVENPSGAVLKSIWRVSFSGDFIVGKKFSFSSRRNEILQTDSLSLLDSSLNFSSNSREKSYFALWVDFDHQCFAERESILKRQFCVVEQYSNFSQQRHFGESIL